MNMGSPGPPGKPFPVQPGTGLDQPSDRGLDVTGRRAVDGVLTRTGVNHRQGQLSPG